MNYQENMMIAINDQSSSITSLQISQAESTDFMAEILDSVYQTAESDQKSTLQLISAFNQFYSVTSMDRDDMANYFENYNGGSYTVEDGATAWEKDFTADYPNVTLTNTAGGVDPSLHEHWDETSDWEISFTLDGHEYNDMPAESFDNNVQDYIGVAQNEYQTSQQVWSNQEQGDQSILQDQQSGVQGTAQSGSNILSTGSSLAQGLGFTSSLLASPM